MRVLLASPESKVWSSRKHIPLGLGYLAASLRQVGHEVEIYDGAVEVEPFAEVLERAEAERRPYGLVGISSVTPLIYEAWQVAAQVKERGIPTVLGGPHLTILPHESMEKPVVDFVVTGEGEDTIVELVQALEEGGDFSTIQGLLYRRDGQIVQNTPRPLRDDLDNIPFPAHDLYKIERYTNLQPLTDGLDPHARAYTITTSRGCPYQCIFCSKPITGTTWRARSPQNVVAEWRWLVEDLRATEIGLTDDIWNLDPQRAKEICRQLIDQGLNTVPWVTVHGMKVNRTDLELFQLMKAAGCKRVGFGVECGDERILKEVIKKGQTVEMVREAFANARSAGLETMGFFIFGLPGESEETMDKTIELALELDPDLANFLIAAPFPGTEMYDLIKREGNIFAKDWHDFAIHEEKARFEIGDLTAELVERKWREAYRRFYLRPSRIARRIFNWDTWRRFPARLGDARRFFVGGAKARC
ncbi:MAG: B12-binding domain-containing radical SAM protein [Anaerolineae bacterium]